jgi:ligand-binding sensor domain-containing protein
MKRLPIALMLILVFYLQGRSQDNRYMVKPAEIKLLPSSNLLTSIEQDSLGFIWIGSMNGLYRYDGFRTVPYLHKKNDTSSLSHNFVQSIDRYQNQLWISTFGAGINVLDLDRDQLKPVPGNVLGQDGRIIIKIVRSEEDDCFWAASPGNIFKISNNRQLVKQYDLPLVVRPETRITDIADTPAELFISTGEELIILEKKSGNFKRPASLLSPDWARLYRSTKSIVHYGKKILVGGDNGVLLIEPGKQNAVQPLSYALNREKRVRVLMVDRQQRIWLANDNQVIRYDDPTTAGIVVAEGLEGITDMMQDHQGNIWLTTQKQGVFKLINVQIPFQQVPGLASLTKGTTINSIIEESDSTWLIGSDRGLLRYHRRSSFTQLLDVGYEDIQEPVYGLFIDSRQRLWLSSRKNGMRMREPGKEFHAVTSFNPIVSGAAPGFMFFFYEDQRGIWGGFYSNYNKTAGLYLYDEQRAIFIQKEPNRKDTAFTYPYALSQAIVDQQKGFWWIGSWNGGLFRINTQREPLLIEDNIGIQSADRKRLSLEIVSCVILHSSGMIYCGTVGGGINAYDPARDTTINYTITEGLASNLIYRMEEDGSGVIWISTDNGITAFDPRKKLFTNFHKTSGLDHISFNFIASMKAKDGTIAFGTNNGHVVYFDPGRQLEKKNSLQTLITDIRLGSNPLKNGNRHVGAVYLQDSVVLNYKDASVISIDLTNMDLADPSTYTFEYTLEGFDKTWTRITDRNTITYTNLDPGSYTLHFRSADHLGRWSEKTLTLYLKILPPFWMTPWFYLLLLAIAALAIYSLFQYQLKQKLRLYQLRNKLHRDLHDDVGATLSSIKAYSEILRKDPENPVIADLIKDNSEEMIDRLEVISWSMKPEQDRFISLHQRMMKVAAPLCRARDIEFEAINLGFKDEDQIPAEFRQNIFLIFKEALNNAVKYSGASRICLRHIRENGKYIMELEDNGSGIDAERRSSGNGLRNMKNRADELHAELEIRTGPRGTAIRLVMQYPLQLPRIWGIGKK